MSNQTKEKKRGRPAGQKSYASVTVVELAKLLKSKKVDSLPVSKKFLRSIGVDETKFPDAEAPVIPTSGKIGRPKAEKADAKLTKPVTKKKASKPKAKKTAPKKTSSKNESEEIPMVVTA